MKKIVLLLFIALAAPFITLGQTTGTTTCNLSVTIDSNVVRPCFRLGGNNSVNGGSCGCSNTLWAIVNGGTAPYTYSWTTSGGFVWGNADTLQGACYELWKVTVKDASGCVDSSSLNVLIPGTDTSSSSAGINKYVTTTSFKLYPVPANNQLNVSLAGSANNTHIEMYDMLGKKLLEQSITNGANHTTIDVSSFSAGNYFIRIIGGKTQQTAKFTIDK